MAEVKLSECGTATHPWISFAPFDPTRVLGVRDWVLLGECASKVQHLISTPLMPKFAERMRTTYISRGILGTAAIEGNTLTQDQVERSLVGDLTLPPSQEYLGREIENLQRAYTVVASGILDPDRSKISEDEIKLSNQMILEGLPPKPDVVPGEYASKQHGVGTYRAPSPGDIRRLMPCFVQWINEPAWDQDIGSKPALHILRAIVAHLYLAWIHPFGDGNGRTARMIEADILARSGVPDVSYHLLSSHYNQTRSEYYRVLALSSVGGVGNPGVFIRYALQGFVDGLRQQISEVKAQHREIVWRDYVHDVFRMRRTERCERIKKVAMDLALQPAPVPKAELWKISDRVVDAYHNKTLKTVSRDLTELVALNLVRKTGGGYVANTLMLDDFVASSRLQPRAKSSRKSPGPTRAANK